jgi:Uri superfamily endonuclease
MAKAKRKATAESAVRRELRSPLTSKQRWTLDRLEQEGKKKTIVYASSPETLERLQSSKPKALNLNSTQMQDI